MQIFSREADHGIWLPGVTSSDNLDYDVKYPDDYPDELLIVRNPSNNTTVVNKTDNNNEEYDPNDLTSGTPEDINNYN